MESGKVSLQFKKQLSPSSPTPPTTAAGEKYGSKKNKAPAMLKLAALTHKTCSIFLCIILPKKREKKEKNQKIHV